MGARSFFVSAICLSLAAVLPAHAIGQPGDPAGSFEITRFEVEGDTLLGSSAVQYTVAPFTGTGRDFAAIEHAVAALQSAYRKRGFALVRVVVPAQELNQGVVHLRVIEPRFGKIVVSGNSFHTDTNIQRSLPAVKPGAIVNTEAVSESLATANENPSKQVTLEMQSAGEPGVIDALEKVSDVKTWSIGGVLDNSGQESSGRDHVSVQYQNFDVGGLDHVLGMQYTTSMEEPSDLRIYGAGYHIPLYGLSDSLDFYASYSNVNSGTVSAGLLQLAVSGAGAVFGVHFNHDFPRIGHYESQLTLGLDRKEFRNDIDFAGQPLGGDVTVDPLSLSYVGRWPAGAGNFNFYLTGARNIPGGSQGSDANFTAARSGASSSYWLLRYGAGFDHALPHDWQLRLLLNGQTTPDALIPGEQFGVGGASSVRGLEERALQDDRGVTGNAEIYTPNLCLMLGDGATRCTALGFFDSGHLTHNDALPGELQSESVESVGVGLRVSRGRNLSLSLDYGHVVSASNPLPSGLRQSLHAFFALSY